MNPQFAAVALRAAHRCEYCRAPEAIFNAPFEAEHITPVSRGGISGLENLALACRSCNSYEAARVSYIDPETREAAELFHPRRHSWDEHIRFDQESAEIIAHTPVGRATAVCLRMNSTPQVSARRLWMRLGLYP